MELEVVSAAGMEPEKDDAKIILQEHIRLIPDDPEFSDGMTLIVSVDDDDDKHIKEHARFLKEHANELSIKSRDRMKLHIKKHLTQKKEKLKLLGLSSREVEDVSEDINDFMKEVNLKGV